MTRGSPADLWFSRTSADHWPRIWFQPSVQGFHGYFQIESLFAQFSNTWMGGMASYPCVCLFIQSSIAAQCYPDTLSSFISQLASLPQLSTWVLCSLTSLKWWRRDRKLDQLMSIQHLTSFCSHLIWSAALLIPRLLCKHPAEDS